VVNHDRCAKVTGGDELLSNFNATYGCVAKLANFNAGVIRRGAGKDPRFPVGAFPIKSRQFVGFKPARV